MSIPILDQRVMTGPRPLPTPEAVRAHWEYHGRVNGFVRNGLLTPKSELIDTGLEVVPYINHGRWVADCPLCGAGLATWPVNPDAACLECGSIFRCSHPSPEVVADAEATLLVREVEHRNWYPKDESPQDLRHENIARGYKMRTDGVSLDDAPPPPKVAQIIREQFADRPAEAEKLIADLRRQGVL